MTPPNPQDRWRTDGKFFRAGSSRVSLHAVTYGPFPGGWPASYEEDFRRLTAAGCNALRLYEMPDIRLLDAAWQHGLRVFGGLKWGHHADFIHRPALFTEARVALVRALKETAGHSALVGIYVGNEVPADLARWMGPWRVRKALEELIDRGRETAPNLMFAYANYPSTEYLEPENADFSAFNLFLEDPAAFRSYLKRLHHIAGDRPLVISEFGLDSRRHGLARQAEVLTWALEIARDEEVAGFTTYAWSDRWWNAGSEVLDWDFGLTDRYGVVKPALAAFASFAHATTVKPAATPLISIIICTRNGQSHIEKCLAAVRQIEDGRFETLVVDDGSVDQTADAVAANFPWVRLLRLPPVGLSAARNAGAVAAHGEILAFTDDDCEPDREWLARLRRVFADPRFAAAGGPNLPPRPRGWQESVVCAAPGAPSHVMLDDEEAEHLPGCNLAVTKQAFDAIGGFDPVFHTAGDDVDFCWRLRAAGYRLGFAPGAFVWHWRRTSLRAFLRQQLGYGHAERLLIAKHPEHFSKRGGAKWQGFVYAGGPIRVMADSLINHGPMGSAGYQSIINRMLPLRGLDSRYNSWREKIALRVVAFLAPRLRAWMRNRTILLGGGQQAADHPCGPQAEHRADRLGHHAAACHEFALGVTNPGNTRDALLRRLLAARWKPGGATDDWDAQKRGTRVLLATALGDDGSHHVLGRVWGDVDAVRQLLVGDGLEGSPSDRPPALRASTQRVSTAPVISLGGPLGPLTWKDRLAAANANADKAPRLGAPSADRVVTRRGRHSRWSLWHTLAVLPLVPVLVVIGKCVWSFLEADQNGVLMIQGKADSAAMREELILPCVSVILYVVYLTGLGAVRAVFSRHHHD